MDKLERAQIRLLLDHLGDELRAEATQRQKTMHADHSAKGTLRSGDTIKSALLIAEEIAANFVKAAFDAASGVAQDIDAFNMVLTDITIILRDLRVGIDQALGLAARANESAVREANRLFAEMHKRTLRLAEIQRFSFTRPAPSTRRELGLGVPAVDVASPPKNRGGAPIAAHWDEMWADIAVQLWEGELQPKRQKDISDAMFTWLNARELDAGNTAVTDRARALWQKVEARLRS